MCYSALFRGLVLGWGQNNENCIMYGGFGSSNYLWDWCVLSITVDERCHSLKRSLSAVLDNLHNNKLYITVKIMHDTIILYNTTNLIFFGDYLCYSTL